MSRFANLKKIIETPEEIPAATPAATSTEHPAETPAAPAAPVVSLPAPAARVDPPQPETLAKRKRGRPEGKRSDPSYTSTTFYIEKEVLQGAQVKLIQEGKTRDVSEVVNALLKLWTAGNVKI
ncbi:hypothetical protein [Deinococcus roseus]|uniref:CopG family transcriptional regulator n=1 Tax=Deinococcus roseus TaxID=392414 RepID=A0ABQ2DL69_9DEIO|nr:hypothetical protein [Deinococcus roseus]GGJ58591.1 hypothetical protein GCM10008938_50900 [Deinococcus roseus]